jgi:PAS domain S-box-containing protein
MKFFNLDFFTKRKERKMKEIAEHEALARKLAQEEEELEKKKKQLEKEEQLKSDTPLVKKSAAIENSKVKIWRPRPTDAEKTFAHDEILVSKTDVRGNITYGNELFVKLSGYTQEELLGQPHNMIRHPDMPKLIFKALWDTISQGKEINAYVVNLAKNGEYYWVYANVTPSFDREGNIIGYYSVRRQPNPAALKIIKPFYHELRKAEAVGGIHESTKLLVELLESKGMDYPELIFRLQYNRL